MAGEDLEPVYGMSPTRSKPKRHGYHNSHQPIFFDYESDSDR